jgi:subtilisin family serine protease
MKRTEGLSGDCRSAEGCSVNQGLDIRRRIRVQRLAIVLALFAIALVPVAADNGVPDEGYIIVLKAGATWGLDRTDQRALPLSGTCTYTATGAGVSACVLDTGIRKTHAGFGGRAVHGFDAVSAGLSSDDRNGHGTHVAGTIGGTTYGIAKGVRLVAVRGLDCAGNESEDACPGSPSGVTEAITVGVWWLMDTMTLTVSGTSQATPHTAGVAALYLEGNPASTPQQVRDALFSLATKNIVTNAQSANNHLLFSNL